MVQMKGDSAVKTVVSFNLGNFGSTGRIMSGINQVAREHGYRTYQAYPQSRQVLPMQEGDMRICSTLWNRINQKMAYYTGLNGCFAPLATRRLLHQMDLIQPDILHFHNLHNSYVNLPMLFDYVRRRRLRVVWTLHDCWSFTGHCPHFVMAQCDRWQTGCGNCPQLAIYPPVLVDRTGYMWKKKREWFSDVENLTLVTPSQWLAKLVRQSFLREYPVAVINNGIDLDLFYPRASDFRARHGIKPEQTVLLGVAFDWGARKGWDVFAYLAEKLDTRYVIVLVGVEQAAQRRLPQNVICIQRTHDRSELAEIYTAADLFVNPTREESFPTVNMEALACGTPVLTFDTGGSPEILNKSCGAVVPCDDLHALEGEIHRIARERPYLKSACIQRAKLYNQREKFQEYIRLYERL